MLMSTGAWSFTIRVTRTEAYDVVETGHVATVDTRTQDGIVVFDYTIDAYLVQRHYQDGKITTIAAIEAESVTGSPFAPFAPGIHWVADRVVDSVPRDEITLTIGGTDAQTVSPNSIADPAAFDEAVQLAAENAAVAARQIENTEAEATERLREMEISARALIETASAEVDRAAAITYEQQVGDPVLAASGKLVLSVSDMALHSGRPPIEIRRIYRSSTDGTGSFGPGWSSILDARIIFGVTPKGAELAQAATEGADKLAAGISPEAIELYERALDEITITVEDLVAIRNSAERSRLALDRYHYTGPGRTEVVNEIRRLENLASSLRDEARSRITTLGDVEQALIDSFTRANEGLPLLADQLRETAETYRLSDSVSESRDQWNDEFLPGGASGRSPEVGNDSVVVVGLDGIGHRYVESADEPGLYTSSTRRDALLRGDRDGTYSLVRKDSTILTFGRSGELRDWLDCNGTGLRFVYDAQSRLSTISDTYGREVRVSRDESGLICRLEGPLGHAILYGYDSRRRLVAVTDAAGDTTRYTYEDDRVVRVVRPDGTYREYRYEVVRGSWRVVATTDEEGFSERFDHSQPGRTIHTSAEGVKRFTHTMQTVVLLRLRVRTAVGSDTSTQMAISLLAATLSGISFPIGTTGTATS